MNRFIILILTFIFSLRVYSFPCVFTFAKSNCWSEYDVTVNLMDIPSEKVLATMTLAKDKLWDRKEFSCNPSQTLLYTASFTPEIWEGSKGVVYKASHYWTLPPKFKAEKAWEIPVCFPDAFSEVPFPPKATGTCSCDFKSIPPLPPR